MNALKKDAHITKCGRSFVKYLKQYPNPTGTWRLQRKTSTPYFQSSSPYPLKPTGTIFIISAGRSVSCLIKINRRSCWRLCGIGGRVYWEAVYDFCENGMFLDIWVRSIMRSDYGKWWEVIVASMLTSVRLIKIQGTLIFGNVKRYWYTVVLLRNTRRKHKSARISSPYIIVYPPSYPQTEIKE